MYVTILLADCANGVQSPMCSSGKHNSDVIMNTMASQITSFTIVYSTVYSGADQRKHQNSASLAFVWGIHRKMFPFDDVIMKWWRYRKIYIILAEDDDPRHTATTKIFSSGTHVILDEFKIKCLIIRSHLAPLVVTSQDSGKIIKYAHRKQ